MELQKNNVLLQSSFSRLIWSRNNGEHFGSKVSRVIPFLSAKIGSKTARRFNNFITIVPPRIQTIKEQKRELSPAYGNSE